MSPIRTTLARTASLLALCLALALPGAARAQEDADADWDGVADAVDACPDTALEDLVGPDGCVICSCEEGTDGTGWSSHRAYVACVRRGVKAMRADGVVDGPAARQLVRAAKASTCGSPDMIRCCVFQSIDDEVGRCRIMSEDACDALDDRLWDLDGEANDEDTGHCTPNPCVF